MIKIEMDAETLGKLGGATLISIDPKQVANSLEYSLLFKAVDNTKIVVMGNGPIEPTQTTGCLNCGRILTNNYSGKCPDCGDHHQEINVTTSTSLEIGVSKTEIESEENSNEINWFLFIMLFILILFGAIFGAFVNNYGFWVSILVSLLFSLISSVIGYHAIAILKLIEKSVVHY